MNRYLIHSGIFATALSLSLSVAPAASTFAQSQESSMTDSTELRNKALVQAKFEGWRAGTGSPFELLAEDASWTIVGRSAVSRTYQSREDFMREVIRPFNARMKTPLGPSIRSLYAEGDTVIVFFDAEATALDGEHYRNTYAWFMDLRDGKVIRATAFFDSIEFNELWARVAPPAT
jgi:uncharacterized protein